MNPPIATVDTEADAQVEDRPTSRFRVDESDPVVAALLDRSYDHDRDRVAPVDTTIDLGPTPYLQRGRRRPTRPSMVERVRSAATGIAAGSRDSTPLTGADSAATTSVAPRGVEPPTIDPPTVERLVRPRPAPPASSSFDTERLREYLGALLVVSSDAAGALRSRASRLAAAAQETIRAAWEERREELAAQPTATPSDDTEPVQAADVVVEPAEPVASSPEPADAPPVPEAEIERHDLHPVAEAEVVASDVATDVVAEPAALDATVGAARSLIGDALERIDQARARARTSRGEAPRPRRERRSIPRPDLSRVSLPNLSLPSVSLPKLSVPSLRAPQVRLPRIRLDNLDLRRLAGVLVVLVVLAAWVSGRDAGGSDAIAAGTGSGVGAAALAPDAPTLTMIVVAEPGGRAEAVTVVVDDGDSAGVVFFPVGSMVEVPSFGLEEIGAAHEVGGAPLVRTAVENVLGARLTDVVTVSPEGLGELFAQSLFVEVPERIEQLTDRGRVEIVWQAGTAALDGDDVTRFLLDDLDSTELATFPRQQAWWSAWIDALETSTWEAPQAIAPELAALVTLASGLGSEQVTYETLPVEVIGPGSLPDTEIYRVDRVATAAMTERLLPDDVAPLQERTRVQLLNGTGTPGLARLATAALVPAGAEVLVVDNADRFDHAVTQIVYYDDAQRPAAEALLDALGVGELVKSRVPLTVVDVTVVVGADFDA